MFVLEPLPQFFFIYIYIHAECKQISKTPFVFKRNRAVAVKETKQQVHKGNLKKVAEMQN